MKQKDIRKSRKKPSLNKGTQPQNRTAGFKSTCEKILLKYKGKEGALIPVLQETQEAFGYLPEKALIEVSRSLGIPLSKIYGVISFYTQFYLNKRGKNTIKCCLGTACYVKGAKEVINAIRKELSLREEENTTKDFRFTIEIVRCLGTCFLAPAIMINNDYYGNLTAGDIPKILKIYK